MGAVFRPAWLASRIDPTALLRHDEASRGGA